MTDPIGPGWWSARYGPQKVRMVALQLRDGGSVVLSPGACDEATLAEVAAWAPPRFLLAPNHFHNGGIALWKRRFPDAAVVAHPVAQPRLRRQVPGVEFGGLEALEAALPDGARLLCPPGARQGETWLSAPCGEGRAWFVTDALVNEPRLAPGPLGWGMWLVGFRPGLIVNPFFRRFFLDDARAFAAWTRERLAEDTPTVFVPSHGRIVHEEAVAAITAVLATIDGGA